MRALFRVDASATIGSGHLSRCLTLARGLRAAGFTDLAVATRDASAHTLDWVAREGLRAVAIEGEELAASRAAASGAELVVIDGYAFGPDLHDALRAPGRVVCVIDDLATGRLGADVLLNGNLYGEEIAYEVREDAVLLCGPAYALVREEMVRAREARESTRREAGAGAVPGAAARPKLLITMGGADPTCETEKALEALAALAPMDIKLVVGGANPRAPALREAATRAAAAAGHALEVLVDVRDMGVPMAWCDVALTAAGSTCLELACIGVAAVAIVVADNQRGVAAALARRGLMDVLGESSDVGPEAIATAVRRLMADPPRRAAMEAAQKACVDGKGKDRAAARLAELVGQARQARLP